MKKLFDSRLNTRYLFFLLKQNRRLMMFLTILFLYVFPFNFYSNYRYVANYTNYSIDFENAFFGGVLLFIFLTVLIPCILLSFLMDRNKMDTYQTLPIRKHDFFFNHFIEACLVLLIPFSIGWISNLVVGVVMFPNDFNVITWIFNLGKVFLFTPLLISLTQFAFISSGRFFDGILYAGIVHLSQFFVLGIITSMFNDRLFGLSNFLDAQITSYISFDVSLFNWLFNQSNPMTFVWILLGVGLYLINNNLYPSRKVEKIDNSSVFSWFLPLITTVVFGLFIAFFYIVFLPFDGFINSVALPFIFGLIAYLIIDGIIHRSFNQIGIAFLKYSLISAIAISAVYGSIITGFFSLTKKVPTENSVEHVILVTEYKIDDLDSSYQITEKEVLELVEGYSKTKDLLNGSYYSSNLKYYHFESQDDKQMIINMHHSLINDYYAKRSPLKYNAYDIYENQEYPSYIEDYPTNHYFLYIKDNNLMMRRNYILLSDTFEEYLK